MQLLNEMKQPICKDTSPNSRYNIENTLKNLNLYFTDTHCF